MTTSRQLEPTGECWCGCGGETAAKSFFLPGHDRVAEAAIIKLRYGSVAALVEHHGFGPGRWNARQALNRQHARE